MESAATLGRAWGRRRVLVTGAAGFIGSWLVKELLSLGAHVVALVMDEDPQSEFFRSGDWRRATVVNGRLQDSSALQRAVNVHETDTVFHLAAQTLVGPAWRAPWETFESNIRGTYNLLEVCRLHPGLVKRIVVASSDKAYGGQPGLPYRETMPLEGRQPYEVSKSCADLLAQSYFHSYRLPVAIARCGNVYGGGDLNWSRIVPGTIRSLWRGERPVIRSDGSLLRDYVYVKDVVNAYLLLAENLGRRNVAGESFNFGLNKPMTVLAVVTAISRLMGLSRLKPDIRKSARGEIASQYLCAQKARRALKWRPAYELEAGLQETIAWYQGTFKAGACRHD
ncbi:MAG TPA: sugar dehydratase [Elusimicrobia bacterium]|nr:sugar dehydratase [Elusimicrobiota bacterium]HBT62859.1 sugar dehydratase [Elusimicrobiota bacterium]